MEESFNTIQELGLTVTHSDVEIGNTYMIFGMITDIQTCSDQRIKLSVNYNLSLYVKAENEDKVEFLKARAFESGIFVSTITNTKPDIEAECKTIIFGRPQAKCA